MNPATEAADPVADALLRHGVLDAAQLELARRRANLQRLPLHRAVVDLGFADEVSVYRVAAEAFGLEFVEIEEARRDAAVLERVQANVSLEHRFAPLVIEEGVLTAAFAEPPTLAELGRLRLLLGLRVRARLCGPTALREFVQRNYGLGADTILRLRAERPAGDGGETVFDVRGAEAPDDATIVHFVDQLLAEALRLSATDIHLEPFAGTVKLRYRVDGLLQDVPVPEGLRAHYLALVSRLKVMADLDITERRLAHDGRIAMTRNGAHYDLRVSIIPTPHGETICLRVLGRDRLQLDMSHLGMEPEQRALMEELVALPQGLALITGPTGSGKTTTLYALLAGARDGRRKIVTIEDPVEYKLDGVSQIQTRAELGLDFASGLRSVLRHDPDVILIGEIRDRETADVAMRSAQTGHLVFSTLHTNDSLSAITRLIDMGVEPWVIGSSLVCSVAQRLARRVCVRCAEPDDALGPEIRAEMAAALGIGPEAVRAMRGRGCPACRGVGESGRVAIYEIFLITDEVVDALSSNLRSTELRAIARRQGWRSLRQEAWAKVQQGLISVAETQRLTRRLQLGATSG
jgi:general secretion pathway protein E/type IV pilus assembly protein PilB